MVQTAFVRIYDSATAVDADDNSRAAGPGVSERGEGITGVVEAFPSSLFIQPSADLAVIVAGIIHPGEDVCNIAVAVLRGGVFKELAAIGSLIGQGLTCTAGLFNRVDRANIRQRGLAVDQKHPKCK